MKKKMMIIGVGAALIFAIMLIQNFSVGTVTGETIRVDDSGGEDYTTIQEAIDDADDGDVVLVYPGLYNENIFINKSITLEGRSNAFQIINGTGGDFVIKIGDGNNHISNVNIINFTLFNATKGVDIINSSSITISDLNIIACFSHGIDMHESNDITIENSIITDITSGIGIEATLSESVLVRSNIVENNNIGMNFHKSDVQIISNNVTQNADSGIRISNCNSLLMDNNISSNGGDGVYIRDIPSTQDVTLQSNLIWNNSQCGINVTMINKRTEVTVKDTTISDSNHGIYLYGDVEVFAINSTILESTSFDFYIGGESRLILLNTSFDSSSVKISADGDSKVVVMNYLEVFVQYSDGAPVEGAEVEVKEDETIFYQDTTGSEGLVSWVETVHREYIYKSDENYQINDVITGIVVSYNSYNALYEGDPENIDMSTSHREVFEVDTIPPIISYVGSFGNVSKLVNKLDRNQDDVIIFQFTANEPGTYTLLIDTNQDSEYHLSEDAVLIGTAIEGINQISWDGKKDGEYVLDGEYGLNISYLDDFDNPSEQSILISMNITNTDRDGDGVPDSADPFPDDESQWEDTDGDGYGDNPIGMNPDAFYDDSTQWSDSDEDGFGDNRSGNNPDKFPDDPAASKDSDNDGYPDRWNQGMSEVDSTTDLILDAFPNEPTQWSDRDDDGYGDNLTGVNPDLFPSDPDEWEDSDGDGHGDNADEFDDNPDEWEDSDGDGIGDNSDFLPAIHDLIFYLFIIIIIVVVIVIAAVARKKRKPVAPPTAPVAPVARSSPPPRAKPAPSRARPPPPRTRPAPPRAKRPPPPKKARPPPPQSKTKPAPPKKAEKAPLRPKAKKPEPSAQAVAEAPPGEPPEEPLEEAHPPEPRSEEPVPPEKEPEVTKEEPSEEPPETEEPPPPPPPPPPKGTAELPEEPSEEGPPPPGEPSEEEIDLSDIEEETEPSEGGEKPKKPEGGEGEELEDDLENL